ncbi:MAG TPA: ABC transporter permease [Candidatus Angelobacter sp.]|nr:ABC transporter permease [Candidatus Angelobacter sp.]
MSSFLQDLRFGARTLLKNPGFTVAAVLTLALGIGANTAIFTVTSSVLIKPLPYRNPGRLVFLATQRRGNRGGEAQGGFSLNRYDMLRSRSRSFSGIGVFATDSFNLTGRGEPEQVPIARVSPSFFSVLGVKPQLGRAFTEDEGRPEGKYVVMISDALWRSRFGADPSIVGQTINLDATPYTVIGVLPAGLQFPFIGPADVWTPRYFELTFMTPQHLRLGVAYLQGVARLSPGATLQSAASELKVLDQQYNQENPKAPDGGSNVSMLAGNLQDLTVADLRTRLLFLSAAVGLLLLIACANVASLLLSRALARRKEIAVRTALGAKRSVIIRQLLTESVLLAIIAGIVGLGLSWAATRALAVYGGTNVPQGFSIAIDWRVLVFMLAISVLTGLIFGLFPALQLSRTEMNSTLRDEGRGSSASHTRVQAKGLLVVGQVAFTLVLLIGAGLLVRSFSRLLKIDPGFDSRNVLTMYIPLPTVKYAKPEQQVLFFDDLLRRISALPGVKSASVSAAVPLSPIRITPMLPEGQPEVPLRQRPFIIIEATSPRYLETMRIPLQSGRAFTDADNAQAPKVLIVNQSFARRFWPNENPVGKHVVLGFSTNAEVVGVAADIRNEGLAQDPQPQVYIPYPQLPWPNMNLFVRTNTDPNGMVSAVRGQVSAIDPDQPVTKVQTVDELMDGARAQPRFTMFLLATFSATALALAIVGLYGVLAYSVAQRRQELGIRMALGATRSDILSLVVRQGMALAVIGIGIGLLAALLLTRLMSSLLYAVGTHDAITFALAPLAFLIIALLASYFPARRATAVPPTEALRST